MYWSFHPLADKTNVAYSRKIDTLESIVLFFPQKLVRLFPWTSSETQGLIVGARSLNGRENMARRKIKNGETSPRGQCLTRPVPNGRRRPGFWLVTENFCVILPNQKPERRRPFGPGLARHCPQGLYSPFFTFLLRAIFFRPFRLYLAPTICPWVSEDVPLKEVKPSSVR